MRAVRKGYRPVGRECATLLWSQVRGSLSSRQKAEAAPCVSGLWKADTVLVPKGVLGVMWLSSSEAQNASTADLSGVQAGVLSQGTRPAEVLLEALLRRGGWCGGVGHVRVPELPPNRQTACGQEEKRAAIL
jgi:hypothetical protein